MRVGIDDTDSPQGGCTTHFALEAAAALRQEHGLVLQRLPRLVRLNPNVPWKTRGNAAVALEVGLPSGGPLTRVGESPAGVPIDVDPGASSVAPTGAHEATLRALVERWCDQSRQGTDPAVVLTSAQLPPSLYREAVTDVVEPAAVREILGAAGARYFALGDGRGIVGAAAAAAFDETNTTFELIAYRKQSAWGTRRHVAWESVEAMDRQFPETFNNLDRTNKHIALAPSTPCPVLIGVRAKEPTRLLDAARAIDAGEPWAGYLLFETNQGTDAHIVEPGSGGPRKLTTVSLLAMVASRPARLPGGHVVFEATGPEGLDIECVAYEPTKQFRDVVGLLEPGDLIRAVGAWREGGPSINLEKMELVETAARASEAAPPRCASCGTTYKSSGRRGPLRCRTCGAETTRLPSTAAPPSLALGWYEVPISARRHLAKPIDAHQHDEPTPNIHGAPPPR